MRLVALALLATLVPGSTSASAQDGVIVGRALDAAGDALPGVTVQTVGSTLGEPRLEVTDRDGRYRIATLSRDTYTVLFTLPGFRSVVHDGIDVGMGLTTTVDAEMVVGSDDDIAWSLSVSGPPQAEAAALECAFRRPDGVITSPCRRVVVPGQLLRP